MVYILFQLLYDRGNPCNDNQNHVDHIEIKSMTGNIKCFVLCVIVHGLMFPVSANLTVI